MNPARSIIHFFSLLILCVACNVESDDNVRHFADIHQDGKHSIVGRFPFDPADTPRTHSYKFVYDSQNRPVLVQYLRAGKLGYGSHAIDKVQTKITYHTDHEIREFLNAQGDPAPLSYKDITSEKSNIYSMRFDLDSNGNRISLTNLNIKGEPFRDTSGIVRYFYTYDETGRITKAIGITTDDDSITEENWARGMLYAYDQPGNLIEEKHITRTGEPCQGRRDSVSILKMKYDDDNNAVRQLSYDLNGTLVSGWKNEYNDWGQVVATYGLEQRKDTDTLIRKDKSRHCKYDAQGNLIEQSFRDAQGAVIIDSLTSITRFTYDENGNCVEQIRVDTNGVPARLALGGYQIQPITRMSYNISGFTVETRLYNADTILSTGYFGFAIKSYTYTELDSGLRVETAFLDPDGDPATFIFNGFWSRSRIEINDQGHTTFIVLYDTLGAYTSSATISAYDSVGNKVWEKHTDQNGRLVDALDGPFTRYQYDKYGYRMAELVFDTAGYWHDLIHTDHYQGKPAEDCLDEEGLVHDSADRAEWDSILRPLMDNR